MGRLPGGQLGGKTMQITKTTEGTSLTIALTQRLDATAAPALEAELTSSYDGVEHLILDLSGLTYLSSAGLRILLAAHKRMNKQGHMTVRNVSQGIMEVFEITGFSGVLTIE
jgi:anti-sigma B factor antagonist